ncbi:MAG: hypothetical protein ACRECN_06530 [Methylocella sp.]
MPNASTHGFRRTMRAAVRPIAKTSLHLAGAGTQWARFVKTDRAKNLLGTDLDASAMEIADLSKRR